MNKATLATTRNLVNVASNITSFICRNADLIERGAKALHGVSLRSLALRMELAVRKAYNRYASAQAAVHTARKVAAKEYGRFSDIADNRDATLVALKAELATL